MANTENKVAIVTGANCGLGFQVSRYLCELKYEVILACRSEERANEAVDKIRQEFPEAKTTFIKLDLSDLSSVREFVKNFQATGKPLDVLINNAGIFLSEKNAPKQFTKDNFDMSMGVNHLAHFLLTNLLLPNLKERAKELEHARVIVVTSSLHDLKNKMKNNVGPTSLDNLMLEKEGTYSGFQAYKNSKLANVMFTYELARQLEGTGVTVNCLCPGFIPETGLARNSSTASRVMIRYILKPMFWVFKVTRTIEQGARAILDVATNPALKDVSGKYFMDQKEVASSEESQNEEMQKELWTLSARYCHLEGYDPITLETQTTAS